MTTSRIENRLRDVECGTEAGGRGALNAGYAGRDHLDEGVTRITLVCDAQVACGLGRGLHSLSWRSLRRHGEQQLGDSV
jgi:hypothetical protein